MNIIRITAKYGDGDDGGDGGDGDDCGDGDGGGDDDDGGDGDGQSAMAYMGTVI